MRPRHNYTLRFLKLLHTLFGHGQPVSCFNKGVTQFSDDGRALRTSDGFIWSGPFGFVETLAYASKMDRAFKPRYTTNTKPFRRNNFLGASFARDSCPFAFGSNVAIGHVLGILTFGTFQHANLLTLIGPTHLVVLTLAHMWFIFALDMFPGHKLEQIGVIAHLPPTLPGYFTSPFELAGLDF